MTCAEERKVPSRLNFSADSTINEHEKSYPYDIDSVKSIRSIDASQVTQNNSSIDEERSFIDSVSDHNRNEQTFLNAIQLMMDNLKLDLNKRFDKLDDKFQEKFDQLAQKLDSIYKSNAIKSIMNKIRGDHNLDVPFLPTKRMFHSSYSKESKILFSDFEQYLMENYKDRWTKEYNPILVSMKPQSLEFDILGFAFEYIKQQRPIIESPNIEPGNTTSSCNYLESFRANTIICGEVTTSTLTFSNNDLLLLEKVV